MEKALNDNTSKFYANFPEFPAQQSKLPIGVFDSGYGGGAIGDLSFDDQPKKRKNKITHYIIAKKMGFVKYFI